MTDLSACKDAIASACSPNLTNSERITECKKASEDFRYFCMLLIFIYAHHTKFHNDKLKLIASLCVDSAYDSGAQFLFLGWREVG